MQRIDHCARLSKNIRVLSRPTRPLLRPTWAIRRDAATKETTIYALSRGRVAAWDRAEAVKIFAEACATTSENKLTFASGLAHFEQSTQWRLRWFVHEAGAFYAGILKSERRDWRKWKTWRGSAAGGPRLPTQFRAE
jgi:hypothetical protein